MVVAGRDCVSGRPSETSIAGLNDFPAMFSCRTKTVPARAHSSNDRLRTGCLEKIAVSQCPWNATEAGRDPLRRINTRSATEGAPNALQPKGWAIRKSFF
ncbi:hypothetical protein EVAR_98031_1 [Eumeta japonica]|uniref:Uncharacterized protein n=1 Tax=Eumeta variegata TaxID=151549 RepID=A0A4C1ZX47_EUMVA|nr:hypothetical protein EVAR_98031_1 [Eumeta japonica]